MKTLAILFATVALTASGAANATYCHNGATNYPKCDNNQSPPPPPPPPPPAQPSVKQGQGQQQGQQQGQGQAQGQQMGQGQGQSQNANGTGIGTGVGIGKGGAGGAGGQGGGGGTGTANVGDTTSKSGAAANAASGDSTSSAGNSLSGSIGNDNSSSSYKSSMWIFPAPVFTPPLPMSTCPQTKVKQTAWSFGWNFVSYANSSQDPDSCTMMLVYNNLINQCKYASAQKVLVEEIKTARPGFEAESLSGTIDMTTEECARWKNPPPVLKEVTPVYETILPAPKMACVIEQPKKVVTKKKGGAKPKQTCK